MPEGDPAGYLPRVQRQRDKLKRSKRTPKPVKGQLIGKIVGKPRAGLGKGQAAPMPRTFQPVTGGSSGATKPRKRTYSPRARRSA